MMGEIWSSGQLHQNFKKIVAKKLAKCETSQMSDFSTGMQELLELDLSDWIVGLIRKLASGGIGNL